MAHLAWGFIANFRKENVTNWVGIDLPVVGIRLCH